MKKTLSLQLIFPAALALAAFAVVPQAFAIQLETPAPAPDAQAAPAAPAAPLAQQDAPARPAKVGVPGASSPATAQAASAPADAQSKIPPAGSAAADAPAVPVAEIVARVNDNIISKADLTRAGEQMEGEITQDNATPEQAQARRASLLSDLLDQQLLLSRGKELGVNPDDEVIRRLDEIRKQYHLDSMEELEKAARSQGVSFEDFKQNVRNGAITQMVIRQEVTRGMHATTEDLKAYYRAHHADYEVPESVRLSEILVPTGDTDATAEEAHQRALKIAGDLSHGSDFAAMAKAVSQGPTAQQGGELGEFKRGQLAKQLEDQTFALNAGGVTEPIRTRQGYVVLKVTAHTKAGVRPFEEVQDQISQAAYQDRMQPALRTYLTKLREEAFIDIRPGYTDIHASPNESHPVFSAYAPPPKKADKKKTVKYRFRDRSVMPKDLPPPPAAKPNLEQIKAQPGGPTAVATKTYQTAEANPPAVPGAVAPVPAASATRKSAASGTRKDNGKPVKVRFGQNQPAAALPQAAPAAGTATDAAGNASAPVETASAAGTADADHLSPESRKILGLPDEKTNKTRYSARAVKTTSEKKSDEQAARNANAPTPADADEVTTHAVTEQPLGLNGDTAHVVKPKPTEKQRLQDKKEVASAAQPNAGTPGSADYTPTDAQTPAVQTPARRHKLLGIL